MSRSGYSDDLDDSWELIRWRGAVASAIRGKRGQAFLRELRDALQALPEKRLIHGEFVQEGEVCVIAAIAVAREQRTSGTSHEQACRIVHERYPDPEDGDNEWIASELDIARALACELQFMNDDDYWLSVKDVPESEMRYVRILKWVEGLIVA